MTFRAGEIYVSHQIWSALNACKQEHETTEALAERYLTECLKRDFPGIFDVLDECTAEIDLAKKKNQTRLILWRKTKTNFTTNAPA